MKSERVLLNWTQCFFHMMAKAWPALNVSSPVKKSWIKKYIYIFCLSEHKHKKSYCEGGQAKVTELDTDMALN